MVIPRNPEERADWLDLSQRYRFLYGQMLQDRLAVMGEDTAVWWSLGREPEMPRKRAGPTLQVVARNAGPSHASVSPTSSRRSNPPAGATVADPKQRGESLPPAVRAVIEAVAAERGVSVADIMSWKKPGPIADARQECYRRLRALPWRNSAPSLVQIGIWLHRDHTSVLHGLQKGDRR